MARVTEQNGVVIIVGAGKLPLRLPLRRRPSPSCRGQPARMHTGGMALAMLSPPLNHPCQPGPSKRRIRRPQATLPKRHRRKADVTVEHGEPIAVRADVRPVSRGAGFGFSVFPEAKTWYIDGQVKKKRGSRSATPTTPDMNAAPEAREASVHVSAYPTLYPFAPQGENIPSPPPQRRCAVPPRTCGLSP
jgi:hypothetical protein